MKYYTYQQLKRMSRQELWNIADNEGLLTDTDKRLTEFYFNKSTILEMLSITHREWILKPFINGNKELITN